MEEKKKGGGCSKLLYAVQGRVRLQFPRPGNRLKNVQCYWKKNKRRYNKLTEKRMEFKHTSKRRKKRKEIHNRYNKEKAPSKTGFKPKYTQTAVYCDRWNLFLQNNFRLHFFKRNYLLDTKKKKKKSNHNTKQLFLDYLLIKVNMLAYIMHQHLQGMYVCVLVA